MEFWPLTYILCSRSIFFSSEVKSLSKKKKKKLDQVSLAHFKNLFCSFYGDLNWAR